MACAKWRRIRRVHRGSGAATDCWCCGLLKDESRLGKLADRVRVLAVVIAAGGEFAFEQMHSRAGHPTDGIAARSRDVRAVERAISSSAIESQAREYGRLCVRIHWADHE